MWNIPITNILVKTGKTPEILRSIREVNNKRFTDLNERVIQHNGALTMVAFIPHFYFLINDWTVTGWRCSCSKSSDHNSIHPHSPDPSTVGRATRRHVEALCIITAEMNVLSAPNCSRPFFFLMNEERRRHVICCVATGSNSKSQTQSHPCFRISVCSGKERGMLRNR